MLFHEFYGRVRTCNDMWVTDSGVRMGGFMDRYGTWVALPLEEVKVWQ